VPEADKIEGGTDGTEKPAKEETKERRLKSDVSGSCMKISTAPEVAIKKHVTHE
jgi:hypothetical protein